MGIIRKIVDRLHRDKRSCILSVINAVVLFLLCYFIDNLPYSFVGDANTAQRIEQIRQYFGITSDTVPSDVWFINVAYDRALVDVNDEFGLPQGNIDITDRDKLVELLGQLQKCNYKYIILDVSFTNKYHTPADSALFSLIASMDNIVIAKSETADLADSAPYDKARYSDYSTHISESNFVKFDYIRNGEPSMPYQVYIDMYGNKIHSIGGFYFFNGRLANKSIVLRHPIKLWNKLRISDASDMATQQYYNLGSDILDIGIDVRQFANDKIIVIGDLSENDMHDTYLGKIPGPVINLNAYYALVNDNLSIPYTEIVFIILLYSIISFGIFKRVSLSYFLPVIKKRNLRIAKLIVSSRVIQFMVSLVSITVLLSIVAVILYLNFGLDINVMIPSVYFAVMNEFISYKNSNI